MSFYSIDGGVIVESLAVKKNAEEIISQVPALKKILELSIGRNVNLMVCGWGETDVWEHREDSHSYYVEHYSDYSD